MDFSRNRFSLEKPICVGRHAFGDQYRATDTVIREPGKLKLVFVPENGDEPIELDVHDFKGPGVALAILFEHLLNHHLQWPWGKSGLYLSTKNTILKKYDGRFKDIFQEVYEENI
ncbi:hypothetical protein F511_35345 [Dorcoceras hygrometricum]|uniref:Uncharacterized protein n=1 Tax=Dorcoceras hygrometricum TaxID=472368 RepID=A0A2Z7CP47_9LAMI|nr:hypothetical protein F511_35345 [Dorcoceras hygrometricum]